MDKKKEVVAEIQQLPSGFWAVFIDGSFVDISSASKEAAQAKLDLFLQNCHRGKEARK